MAYVSGFTHDIFISYASVDNEPDAQEVRWVSRFRNDVEIALRQRLGRDIKIFFDQADLLAFHDLQHLIKDAKDSAIFLAVFSPSYVERKWPLEELNAFDEAVRQSPAGERNRIVTIEILPVEENTFPRQIENLKRTRFYKEDKDTGAQYKLTSASDPAVYNERIQQLAHQLVRLLREMRQTTAAVAVTAQTESNQANIVAPVISPATAKAQLTPQASTGNTKTVLLAQVPDDLYDERQKVVSYLEDYGITVVPEGEYPERAPDFAAAVAADMERADLFVQLLSRSRSMKPDGLRSSEGEPAKSYAQFQYDAAIRKKIPILQWRHPEINPDKVPPNNWDKQMLDGPHVRVMGLQEFLKEIRDEIGRLKQKEEKEEKEKEKVKGAGSPDFFFINADRSDQELAQTLLRAFKAQGSKASVPMYEGSAKEIEEDLEENLVDCKGLFLVYGKASAAWVRAQLRRYFKVEPRRREPPRLKTILFGPPSAKPELGVEAGFDTLDCQDALTVEQVEKIIRDLRL